MPVSNPMAGSPYRGSPMGYQQIAAATLAAATALTIPAGATYAVLEAETANVRLRDDGTAVTTSTGIVLTASVPFTYTGDLSKVSVIAASGSPLLNVLYYR